VSGLGAQAAGDPDRLRELFAELVGDALTDLDTGTRDCRETAMVQATLAVAAAVALLSATGGSTLPMPGVRR
jgi:hypothetical protein